MIDFENDVPKVALDFMNTDHEHATEITNQLLFALKQTPPDTSAITTELQALLTHCVEHFDREETLMQQYDFPPYPVHKGEHDRVLAEMESQLNSWTTSRDVAALTHYCEQVLIEWFLGHISCMDTVTARYIQASEQD